MKKLLTAAFCLTMAMGMQSAMAADTTNYTKANPVTTEQKQPPKFEHRKRPPMPNLEEELNLTEAQKAKAKENRIQGRKEMKPIMDEIRAKKEAILDIVDSDLSKEKQQEKITVLQKEIKDLYVKANTIREKNMAEFEKILTKEQKTKFAEIKKLHHPNGCKECAKRMPPPPMPGEEK